MSKIFKIGLLVVLIAGTSYGAACIYANVVAFKKADAQAQVQLPPVSEAKYYVNVPANGNVFLTNNYETWGTKVGQRVFLLHGFWESVGSEFKYRARDLPLDEKIFGQMEIKPRPKPTPTPTPSPSKK